MGNYIIIEKEDVKDLIFPADEILQQDEREVRKLALEKAMILGNIEQIKVKIYFADVSENYIVETTIWGITDDRIILKQGVTIPVNRVINIV